MSSAPAQVRNVSDTALWAAHFRAEESRRPDALFRDPYAEKLGARRGGEMASALPQGLSHAWAWVARTYLFDQLLQKEIADGADLIVNCAAGLDARPYRMQLPTGLQWIEADLPDMLAYKTELLANDKPTCQLERIAVNLADSAERRRFFADIATRGKRGVVLTEGLLIYLSTEEVAQFAQDLSGVASLQRWILDMHSPRLLTMMQRNTGKALEKVGAPFKFGPAEGPEFFSAHGWKPIQVEGMLHTAARFGRPPLLLRLFAKLFDVRSWNAKRPWAGVCLLQKDSTLHDAKGKT
ncbi:MAG TPA: SAM-dependent methyltransferase [Candidatus Acidoferrum sp.]|nr:SAM-dependent methyltransferase [Candidatus Acidoferrum sp.]